MRRLALACSIVLGLTAPAFGQSPVPVYTNGLGQVTSIPATPPSPLGLTAGQAAQIAGAVQAAGGNASATVVLPAAPQATNLRSLAVHEADRLSVADYATNGTAIGGAVAAVGLAAQATTDNVIQIAQGINVQPGAFIAAVGLPTGTTVTGIGAVTTVTQAHATAAVTLTDAQQQAQAASATGLLTGMSNALTLAGTVVLPVGTAVSGTGIASGATVIGSSFGGGTTIVYLSADVTAQVASGASLNFSFEQQPVYLSNTWTIAPAAGIAVGLYHQDDYAAFQNAAFYLAPERGGPGGRIWVPSGSYFLSQPVTTYNGVSFDLGAAVNFVPGSAQIDSTDGNFPAASDASFIGGGRNQTPTEVNISQVLQQRLLPDLQGQALLVDQLNASCTNDGSNWGCGMVGIEVKQSHAAGIPNGVMWEYHGTDTVLPGQDVSWAGAELEILNNSGIDTKWNSLKGNKTGLHIDDLGNTNNTTGLLLGAGGTGKWHRGMDCPTASVLDYCWTVQTGPIAADGTPTLLAGLDMAGNYTGQNANLAGTVNAGAVTSAGFINTKGLSNTSAPAFISDGAASDPQPGTGRALKVSGGGMAWSGGAYGDQLTVTGTSRLALRTISTPGATAYTVAASDCGTTLEPLPTAAPTITIPLGLPLGCQVEVIEVNTLQISFAAGSGMTMRALNGASKISGNYGHAEIIVDGANSFLLSGNIQ